MITKKWKGLLIGACAFTLTASAAAGSLAVGADAENPGKDSMGNYDLALRDADGQSNGTVAVAEGVATFNGTAGLIATNDISEDLTAFTLYFEVRTTGLNTNWAAPVSFGWNDWSPTKWCNFQFWTDDLLRFTTAGSLVLDGSANVSDVDKHGNAFWGAEIGNIGTTDFHKVALTVQPGGKIEVYLDGEVKYSYDAPETYNLRDNTMRFALGGDSAWGNLYDPFIGSLRNVYIYDFAMTAEQVSTFSTEYQLDTGDLAGQTYLASADASTLAFADGEGMRHYRVGTVNMGSGESWENPDHYLAAFGENDGTANSYAIYNSGRRDDAVDGVSAGLSGIFFDDNIWVAKEFYYAYINLGDVKYLNESVNIVNWIIGEGYEETAGLNGIYWKWAAKFLFEDKAGGGGLDDNNHASLNACSSAPTSMMLVKLYNAMGDESLNGKFDALRDDYLSKAQNIYEFCYSVLRNPTSGCLRDKIFLREGFEEMTDQNQQIQLIDQQELGYNTGTFMTAGAELYNQAVAAGKDAVARVYRNRNIQVAEDADRKFANTQVVQGEYSYGNHSWFTSFLLEGFIDLSESVPECAEYIEHMRSSLDYAWTNNRADDSLVSPSWIEGWDSFSDNGVNSEGNPRQILLQSANAHCYAMLARYYAGL